MPAAYYLYGFLGERFIFVKKTLQNSKKLALKPIKSGTFCSEKLNDELLLLLLLNAVL